MIEIHLGNIGSGKTLGICREIFLNLDKKHTFSNINMPTIKNNTAITPEMIGKREVMLKGNKEVEVLKVNTEFWKEQVKKYGSCNVVLDECQNLLDSRRAMSSKSKVMLSFLALLRRVIGSQGEKAGKLVLISQLSRRIDPIAKQMATRIKWYRCSYIVTCKKCNKSYAENNETPEKILYCPNCKSVKLKMHTYIIEVYSFTNIDLFEQFENFGAKTYYSHKIITDGEKYFKYYNSYEWGSLLDEM